MSFERNRAARRAGGALLGAAVLIGCAGPAGAQQPSRERAQMMQMQQQLQRSQQDNSELQGKLQQKDEDLKKESAKGDTTRRQLSAARAEAAAKDKELQGLHAELDRSAEALKAAQAEIEQFRKAVAQRDEALAQAAERERRGEQAQSLLTGRLQVQTSRADRCEVKHAGAMTFAGEVIDQYEKDRLRLCEPVTGLWKPRAENMIQEMRTRLSTYQLEAPVEASR